MGDVTSTDDKLVSSAAPPVDDSDSSDCLRAPFFNLYASTASVICLNHLRNSKHTCSVPALLDTCAKWKFQVNTGARPLREFWCPLCQVFASANNDILTVHLGTQLHIDSINQSINQSTTSRLRRRKWDTSITRAPVSDYPTSDRQLTRILSLKHRIQSSAEKSKTELCTNLFFSSLELATSS